MKNNIIKSIIFLLFISFGSAYADTVPDDLYGKWIKLNEKKDGKNCKDLTIDGKTKCYAIHQSISEAYNDIEPGYVWINKKENFLNIEVQQQISQKLNDQYIIKKKMTDTFFV